MRNTDDEGFPTTTMECSRVCRMKITPKYFLFELNCSNLELSEEYEHCDHVPRTTIPVFLDFWCRNISLCLALTAVKYKYINGGH